MKFESSFVPDVLESPIVLFWESYFDTEKLNRGRFYFVKDLENGESKNANFLTQSQCLFSTVQKDISEKCFGRLRKILGYATSQLIISTRRAIDEDLSWFFVFS